MLPQIICDKEKEVKKKKIVIGDFFTTFFISLF